MKRLIIIAALAFTVSASAFAQTRSIASTEATSGKEKSDFVFHNEISLAIVAPFTISSDLAIVKEPVIVLTANIATEKTVVARSSETPEIVDPVPKRQNNWHLSKHNQPAKMFDERPQK